MPIAVSNLIIKKNKKKYLTRSPGSLNILFFYF